MTCLKMLEALTVDHTLSFLLPLSLSLSHLRPVLEALGGPTAHCVVCHTLSLFPHLPADVCGHPTKPSLHPPGGWWMQSVKRCEREREREREKICIAYMLVHTNILPIASQDAQFSPPKV